MVTYVLPRPSAARAKRARSTEIYRGREGGWEGDDDGERSRGSAGHVNREGRNKGKRGGRVGGKGREGGREGERERDLVTLSLAIAR